MEFLSVDVFSKKRSPNACLTQGKFDIFLHTDAFAKFLKFPSDEAMHKQLTVDVPRCDLWVQGQKSTISAIPQNLRTFCTQASLALPLIFLHNSNHCIFTDSCSQRMLVDVWDSCVFISKNMRISCATGAKTRSTVSIRISVDLHTNVTSFSFSVES